MHSSSIPSQLWFYVFSWKLNNRCFEIGKTCVIHHLLTYDLDHQHNSPNLRTRIAVHFSINRSLFLTNKLNIPLLNHKCSAVPLSTPTFRGERNIIITSFRIEFFFSKFYSETPAAALTYVCRNGTFFTLRHCDRTVGIPCTSTGFLHARGVTWWCEWVPLFESAANSVAGTMNHFWKCSHSVVADDTMMIMMFRSEEITTSEKFLAIVAMACIMHTMPINQNRQSTGWKVWCYWNNHEVVVFSREEASSMPRITNVFGGYFYWHRCNEQNCTPLVLWKSFVSSKVTIIPSGHQRSPWPISVRCNPWAPFPTCCVRRQCRALPWGAFRRSDRRQRTRISWHNVPCDRRSPSSEHIVHSGGATSCRPPGVRRSWWIRRTNESPRPYSLADSSIPYLCPCHQSFGEDRCQDQYLYRQGGCRRSCRLLDTAPQYTHRLFCDRRLPCASVRCYKMIQKLAFDSMDQKVDTLHCNRCVQMIYTYHKLFTCRFPFSAQSVHLEWWSWHSPSSSGVGVHNPQDCLHCSCMNFGFLSHSPNQAHSMQSLFDSCLSIHGDQTLSWLSTASAVRATRNNPSAKRTEVCKNRTGILFVVRAVQLSVLVVGERSIRWRIVSSLLSRGQGILVLEEQVFSRDKISYSPVGHHFP